MAEACCSRVLLEKREDGIVVVFGFFCGKEGTKVNEAYKILVRVVRKSWNHGMRRGFMEGKNEGGKSQ